MNYAIDTDDGISTKDYDRAEVILLAFPFRQDPHMPVPWHAIRDLRGHYPLTEENLLKRHTSLPETLVLSGTSSSG